MSKLLELAERCEKANPLDLIELSRLNGDILRELGWTADDRDVFRPNGERVLGVPNCVVSVDGALALVPIGLGVSMAQHGKRGDDCSAYVGTSNSDARGNFMVNTSMGEAKTMALAVTAACLKASAPKPMRKRRRARATQEQPE